MAANIATANGKEVFGTVRQPAWHRLGTVFPEPIPATEAWEQIGGYDVQKLPLFFSDGSASGVYGLAKVQDGKPVATFGTVSEKYKLVSPSQFVAAWDIAGRNWPIETIGALGDGQRMFLLSRMPDCDINGDEHQRYILGLNDMSGKSSNLLKITTVRVVCQNTLEAALRDNTAGAFQVAHDENILYVLIDWLQDVLSGVESRAAAVKQAYEAMARRRMSEAEVEQALAVAVPVPAEPKSSGSQKYDAIKYERFADTRATAIVRRGFIRGLYEGEMSGYTAATHGTAWGMMCAVSEAMDHLIPSKGDEGLANQAAFGWRAAQKAAAHDYLMRLTKN